MKFLLFRHSLLGTLPLLCLILGVALFANSAFAVPIVFERNFKNERWGQQDNGCFVDENRYVYGYDVRTDIPIQLLTRMPEKSFNDALDLVSQIAMSEYSREEVGVDGGITKYTSLHRGEMIPLRETGNVVGTRNDERTNVFVEIIEAFCTRN